MSSAIDIRTDQHLLIDNDDTILQVRHKAVNEARIKVDCCPVCFERLDKAFDKRKRDIVSPPMFVNRSGN